MKLRTLFFLLIISNNSLAQKETKQQHTKPYVSMRLVALAPLGIFDESYYGGAGINIISHFDWIHKGAEVQAIFGLERFRPIAFNAFGAITTMPLKVGMLQKISTQFYAYGRTGVIAVKDATSPFTIRFSTDIGLGFSFRKMAIDIGVHSWLQRNGGGFSNYFSTGIVLPFRRLN
jgi:hypothetical protein